MHRNHGFTLIELLITIAILGILAAIGVPSFQDFFRSNRVAAASSDMVAAFSLARSEAVKRGQRVVVCKSASPNAATPACTTGGTWAQGWIVFVDTNNDAARASTETLLKVHAALNQVSMSGNGTLANYVSYAASGSAKEVSGAMQMGTMTVCLAPVQRQIVLNTGGRVRVQEGTC